MTELPETQAGMVEIRTRLPHVRTRVTITIDVEPRLSPTHPPSPTESIDFSSESFSIGGGDHVMNLLFATNRSALAANIGAAATDQLLTALRNQGASVLDNLPAGLHDAGTAASMVMSRSSQTPAIRGIVLLGGYDVVPSQRVDTLSADLRKRLSWEARQNDADDFIVWSDDIYGCRDGDGLPELPVSRIPDGKSAHLVVNAVGARRVAMNASRGGVRNAKRPFADDIYAVLPGSEPLAVSEPATSTPPPMYELGADHVYLMLHGSDTDSSRFWGEDGYGHVEAVHISNVPTQCGAVIFTGCCYGALTLDPPAWAWNGQSIESKTLGSALALHFLVGGSTAFIGCTGSHYSPLDPPYQYFGGPLHEAFWRHNREGMPPAEALFHAKLDYLLGIPHRGSDLVAEAIEHKIWRQYTCLGLGW